MRHALTFIHIYDSGERQFKTNYIVIKWFSFIRMCVLGTIIIMGSQSLNKISTSSDFIKQKYSSKMAKFIKVSSLFFMRL
jgi:hypothetical protein